jgi:prepilin-type N-terminal cleavage/methylation domain-containing protein
MYGRHLSPLLVQQKGMTLIEIVVSVAIISVISALVLNALPTIRNQQQLRAATQQIQNQLRAAQQNDLNETRSPDCLQRVGEDKEKQRRCSDVGVAIRQNKIVQFADTEDDNTLSNSGDVILSQEEISSAVIVPNRTWLFEATPPTILLRIDGKVQQVGQPNTTIISAGALKATFEVSTYGYASTKF